MNRLPTQHGSIFWDLKCVWDFRKQVPDKPLRVCNVKLVGEPGGLHVVAGPVGQNSLTSGEQRQAFGFLQHHLQLLEIL